MEWGCIPRGRSRASTCSRTPPLLATAAAQCSAAQCNAAPCSPCASCRGSGPAGRGSRSGPSQWSRGRPPAWTAGRRAAARANSRGSRAGSACTAGHRAATSMDSRAPRSCTWEQQRGGGAARAGSSCTAGRRAAAGESSNKYMRVVKRGNMGAAAKHSLIRDARPMHACSNHSRVVAPLSKAAHSTRLAPPSRQAPSSAAPCTPHSRPTQAQPQHQPTCGRRPPLPSP